MILLLDGVGEDIVDDSEESISQTIYFTILNLSAFEILFAQLKPEFKMEACYDSYENVTNQLSRSLSELLAGILRPGEI